MPNFAQNPNLSFPHVWVSLVFPDNAYNDRLEWYLVTSTDKFAKKNYYGQNFGQNEFFDHFLEFGSFVFASCIQ